MPRPCGPAAARRRRQHGCCAPTGCARGAPPPMYRYGRNRGSRTAASLVPMVGGLFALMEGGYIRRQVFHANPVNKFLPFIESPAATLPPFLPALYTLGGRDLDVILAYG